MNTSDKVFTNPIAQTRLSFLSKACPNNKGKAKNLKERLPITFTPGIWQ